MCGAIWKRLCVPEGNTVQIKGQRRQPLAHNVHVWRGCVWEGHLRRGWGLKGADCLTGFLRLSGKGRRFSERVSHLARVPQSSGLWLSPRSFPRFHTEPGKTMPRATAYPMFPGASSSCSPQFLTLYPELPPCSKRQCSHCLPMQKNKN